MTETKDTATERLYLEKLDASHISEEYAAWMRDQDVLKYLTGRSAPYTLEELQDFVAQVNASDGDHLFGIFLKTDHRHIGNIKVSHADPVHKHAEIGLVIGLKEMWGKGYGSEAIGLVTKYAFEKLGLNKLMAGMVATNVGSYKAFLKAGYRKVGELKRHNFVNGQYVDALLMECFRKT